MSKKMNLKKIIPIIAVALMVLVAVWWVLWRGRETTDDAYVRADTTLISPKVTGYVTQVNFADNQHVKAGDIVVQIDQKDYIAKVAAAQAQVDALKSQNDEQQQVINEALAQSDVAHRNSQRASALQLEGAIANQNADEAHATNKSNKAVLEAAKSHLAVLAAQLQQAQANLQLAQIDLNNTTIRAPQDGIVGNRTVQIGQLVQPGAALAYLIPQNMWVEANYKETQLEHMRPGQHASLSVDAMGGRDLDGTVLSFAPASGSEFSILPPENATGNFTKVVRRVPVKILINTDATTMDLLRPGLSVVVTVDTRTTPANAPVEQVRQPVVAPVVVAVISVTEISGSVVSGTVATSPTTDLLAVSATAPISSAVVSASAQ